MTGNTNTKGASATFVFLSAIIAIVASVTIASFLSAPGPSDGTKISSHLDRIEKTGTIRCGYLSNPPSCIIDPATGKVSGIAAEAFEKAAENLGFQLEWTEEVGFGSMIEGIKADRYDVVPCSLWPTAARSRFAAFSTPLFFSAVGIYTRADDHRFDGSLAGLNDSSVTIATMDGEMAQAIAATSFPEAKTIEVPQTSEITSMLLNVQTGKADVTFVELYFAHEFLKGNPGTLRNIAISNPIRIFPNTILLPPGEPQLHDSVDIALRELINLGVVESLLQKYEPVPGIFYRVAPPFISPE